MNKEKPTDIQQLQGAIIPLGLAMKAMRDSGYQNTAYALAELIDNSVQAKANHVEVICVQTREMLNERTRHRIERIGVLDNGEGMTLETLMRALQFGNGTHLADRAGIGRFGMGLPNSSISQCRRLDVWTWQSGPDNAVHSYLDLDEIEDGTLREVPHPQPKPLPDKWHDWSKEPIGTSGTLVQWTNFDRLSWSGAKATLKNTELEAGRMFRKFIDKGALSIHLLALNEDKSVPSKTNCETTYDEPVRVNDPLYLMHESSTPSFNKESMFQHWGDEVFDIDFGGSKHEVNVRMSWAHEKTFPQNNADRGNQDYGKHAKKNIGLSIVREGRELTLDKAWTISYDPTERWWGAEVEFPSTLDEVFGVTNTKQGATIFSGMADPDWWSSENEPGETWSEFCDRLRNDDDPRAHLMPITAHINRQLKEIRKRLKQQTAGRRKKVKDDKRHESASVEDLATTRFQERDEQGHSTDFDSEEFTREASEKFEQNLVEDKKYSPEEAKDIVNAIRKRKRKVSILTKAVDSYAFFNVEQHQGGVTAIVFNTNHPLHNQLIGVLDQDLSDKTDADLHVQITQAADTLELLFAAWARYELEDIKQQDRLFEMRQEWGKMARFFLTERKDD